VHAPSTRDRLLDAAWAVVSETGVNELTLADVGARAGVSRQTVYLHFGNRSTLLVEMARRIDHSSGFRRRLAAARTGSPRVAFRRVLEEWFEYVPTILPVHRALEAAALVGGDGAAAYRDRMQDWRDGLALSIAPLAEARLLRRRWDVDAATDWTWAQAHPTTYHHLVHERGWPIELTVRTVISTLERELIQARARTRSVHSAAGVP
jgi:AcrR family transcriptional regulator